MFCDDIRGLWLLSFFFLRVCQLVFHSQELKYYLRISVLTLFLLRDD